MATDKISRVVGKTAFLAADQESLQAFGASNLIATKTKIGVDPTNNWFWNFNSGIKVLMGGSTDDNLFQISGVALTDELDLIASVGGNYVRNTMSDRGTGFARAFLDTGGGIYDLTQWNATYWTNFDNFLNECSKRNIIVQIEVWDRFDHSQDNWLTDPYHPDNNTNYTNATSGFADTYPNHPSTNEQPFFYTVPALNNNTVVLPFQEAFVMKMLSYSLNYNNVLYVMDNETGGDPLWGDYWADFIKAEAVTAGTIAEVTEMWDDSTLSVPGNQHENTWDDLTRYSFTDISQNNHNNGDVHFDNIVYVRNYISAAPVPMNNVKIYGKFGGSHGTTAEAINRFWSSLMGGCASVRFHRDGGGLYGLAIDPLAQNQIKGARLVESLTLWADRLPNTNHSLLTNRATNEAYCSFETDSAYVVYFIGVGNVDLDLTAASGDFNLRWLDLDTGVMGSASTVTAGGSQNLTTPSSNTYGHVAVLTKD